jgi:tetratricopeptide (TPR) repeat protein
MSARGPLAALLALLIVAGLCPGAAQVAERKSPGFAAYERANALFTAKKFPECMAQIEEALRLDPKLVAALTLKAKLAMILNRFDISRQSLEVALAADPTSAYAHFLYGLDAYLRSDLQAALPRFEKARQLNPADPRSALYLGLTRESLGQPNDALKIYEEAVRLEQSVGAPQADTFLTGARLLMLLGRLEDCEVWIKRALALEPNSRAAHFEFARLLQKKGDPLQAAKEGELALRLPEGEPAEAQIHYLLIRAYRECGQPAQAARHREALRAIENTQPQGYN